MDAVSIDEVGLWGRFQDSLQTVQEHWFGSFVLNLIGYCVLIIPAAFFIRRWKNDPQVQRGEGYLNSLRKLFAIGVTESEIATQKAEEGHLSPPVSPIQDTKSDMQYYVKLIVYAIGLQVSYLTWGVLQERVMTMTYDGVKFTNSQFLVFSNRILAAVTALVYIKLTTQSIQRAPLYKYSYCSISNTLSSWCQYEALKFVSFPTQVLAKASKVIPVMLMKKVVSNKTYALNEYFTAALLSTGVGLFLLTADPKAKQESSVETSVAGVIILIMYMAFDSFTSNWQDEIFQTYKVSSIQMMFGVNLFSCILTVGSLLFRGVFFSSLWFLFNHSDFAFHVMLLSIASAVGQLFIFHTIQNFGALVFTLIMTLRQALSIFLSCVIYGHELTSQALVGVVIVFISLLLRVYFRTQKK